MIMMDQLFSWLLTEFFQCPQIGIRGCYSARLGCNNPKLALCNIHANQCFSVGAGSFQDSKHVKAFQRLFHDVSHAIIPCQVVVEYNTEQLCRLHQSVNGLFIDGQRGEIWVVFQKTNKDFFALSWTQGHIISYTPLVDSIQSSLQYRFLISSKSL